MVATHSWASAVPGIWGSHVLGGDVSDGCASRTRASASCASKPRETGVSQGSRLSIRRRKRSAQSSGGRVVAPALLLVRRDGRHRQRQRRDGAVAVVEPGVGEEARQHALGVAARLVVGDRLDEFVERSGRRARDRAATCSPRPRPRCSRRWPAPPCPPYAPHSCPSSRAPMVTLIAGSRSACPSCGSPCAKRAAGAAVSCVSPIALANDSISGSNARLLAHDGELERRRLAVERRVLFDEVAIAARIAQAANVCDWRPPASSRSYAVRMWRGMKCDSAYSPARS